MHTGTPSTAHGSLGAGSPRSSADRCPTTTALHRADDGLIGRLRLPGGRLPARAALALAAVAAPGDRIEITSRGNLQLRGLTDAAAARATAAIIDAGLLPSEAHDRARTIAASPFFGRLPGAGLDDAFIERLDVAILARTDTAAVSGRVLTVVSDGTAHASAADADLRVRWDAAAGGVRLAVGGLTAREALPAQHAPEGAAAMLGALATAATAATVWRARELDAHALAGVLVAAGLTPPATPDAAAPTLPAAEPLTVGAVAQTDGRAAVRGVLPLGRTNGSALAAAAELAAAHGTDLRIDPERGLTLVDLPAASVPEVLSTVAGLGLLTDPLDPALGLTACAGLDCTRTAVDVRAAAELRRAERRPGSPREHLVGCDRRCGAPRGGTTVVAAPGDTPQALAHRAALALLPTSNGPEAA